MFWSRFSEGMVGCDWRPCSRQGGLERSAEATAHGRAGLIRGATMGMKSIVEEFQMQAMGGMMAA